MYGAAATPQIRHPVHPVIFTPLLFTSSVQYPLLTHCRTCAGSRCCPR
ncbi:hypothetical protein HBB16_12025 [Pseudonocardia sp. MCCB 268]|nr:hypothetical protein [Pseudonocardia cytotoxica]